MDDDASFRTAIRTLVARTPGFDQVGEAASGEDALTAVASLRPDLVLMDVRMPGIDGFEAASRLLQNNPKLVVALMSADPIEPPPLANPLGASVVVMPKGELSPVVLLDLWQRLGSNY